MFAKDKWLLDTPVFSKPGGFLMSIGSLRLVFVSGVTTIIIFSLLYLALWTENSLDSVTNFGWMLTELAKRLLKP